MFTYVLQLLISSKGDTVVVGISKGFIALRGDLNISIMCWSGDRRDSHASHYPTLPETRGQR